MYRLALVIILLFPTVSVSQELLPLQLVGKQVTVGRLPLCQPGTYNTDLSHSGKLATVVSAKPHNFPAVSDNVLNRMPPSTRALIEEQRKAATLLFQFEDGTKLDTCAPIGPSKIADTLELVPGQQIIATPSTTAVPATASAAAAPPSSASTPSNTPIPTPQECPVTITKVSSTDGGFAHALADAMTTSEFQRQMDETMHGGNGKHYLDIRMRNNSTKNIRAVESGVSYTNVMGDQQATDTLVTQNTKPLKPDQELKSYFMDRTMQSANGRGDVTVFVNRVRFEDGTFWNDNGSHSCKLTSQVK